MTALFNDTADDDNQTTMTLAHCGMDLMMLTTLMTLLMIIIHMGACCDWQGIE